MFKSQMFIDKMLILCFCKNMQMIYKFGLIVYTCFVSLTSPLANKRHNSPRHSAV